jgi:hypothetical protein
MMSKIITKVSPDMMSSLVSAFMVEVISMG